MIRLLLAGAVSLGLSVVITKLLIDVLIRRKIGQPIHEDLNEAQQSKAGTPTMGGVAVVVSALVGYLVSDLALPDESSVFTVTGLYTMFAVVGAGVVGFLDDWLKVTKERNLGLTKRTKTVGLLIVAVGWSLLMVTRTAQHTTMSFTRWDFPGWDLTRWGWVVFAVVLIYATTNAVNLADGMDGLAAGSSILGFSAFAVIGFWAFRHPEVYNVPHALDLAVVAVAMLAACTGFLWWNAAPAQIFMGDTGALAIGAGLACLALALNAQWLLFVVGGVFVMETVSVIIQVTSFRVFGGRRVFRMAPIHHHFELSGWPETTVVVRLWILAGLLAALGLGLYYSDFLSIGGAL